MKGIYTWICDQFWLLFAIFQATALDNKRFIIPNEASGFLRVPAGLMTRRFEMFLDWWGYQTFPEATLELMPRRMSFVHWDGQNWKTIKNEDWKHSQNAHIFFCQLAA